MKLIYIKFWYSFCLGKVIKILPRNKYTKKLRIRYAIWAIVVVTDTLKYKMSAVKG